MNTHELKTDPQVFEQSWNWKKAFEIRKDDRVFEVGDILYLKETEHSGEQMRNGFELGYTGRAIEQVVTYILRGPVYGLKDGWVILSVDQVACYEGTGGVDSCADQAM